MNAIENNIYEQKHPQKNSYCVQDEACLRPIQWCNKETYVIYGHCEFEVSFMEINVKIKENLTNSKQNLDLLGRKIFHKCKIICMLTYSSTIFRN